MAIKSEVVEKKKEKGVTYPYLMKDKVNGVIVLFTNCGSGTVVGERGGVYLLGYHSCNWYLDCFDPFYGSVTLSSNGDT